jgi:hypothetical protein
MIGSFSELENCINVYSMLHRDGVGMENLQSGKCIILSKPLATLVLAGETLPMNYH